jgi:4-diphosphocytidyl-2-C-methyl-D-erythritol kinase
VSGTVREFAPAKINLALAVTGRRPDGYHLLDTLVVFAEFGDVVEAGPDDALSLAIDGPFAMPLSADDGNLVLRAANRLQTWARRSGGQMPGASLRLTKSLPVAAGLGGGSADAAAALRALNRLWRLGLGTGQLAGLGAELGADIAMCLHSRALRATGIGATIAPLERLPALPLVLVNPGVPLSTRDVFARVRGRFSDGLPPLPPLFTLSQLIEWLGRAGNDLTPSACALAPGIAETIAALDEAPGCRLARMSGSGASCFGIFDDQPSAQRAAQMLSAAHPSWWVRATSAG